MNSQTKDEKATAETDRVVTNAPVKAQKTGASKKPVATATGAKTAAQPTPATKAKATAANTKTQSATKRTSVPAVRQKPANPVKKAPVATARENAAVYAESSIAPTPATDTPASNAAELAPAVEASIPAMTGVQAGITSDMDDLADGPAPDAPPAGEQTPGLSDERSAAVIAEEVDFDALRVKLIALQQKVRAAQIPVVIVFEGWDTAGKGTLLSKLIEGLDPRGYQVYPIRKPTNEEKLYPTMRRYYLKMPAQGDISLFCGSWYREVSNACFESRASRKRLNQSYDEIVNMESQLVSDGVLLIKFFLHIPRKEQKARLKELESKKATRWRVEKEDWEQNERYEEYLRLYDAMIARTHFDGALWHVLRSDNKRACVQQVYDIVIDAFEAALQDRAQGKREWDTPYLPHLENIPTLTIPPLDAFDPDQALSDPYKPAVDKAQSQLSKLQNELFKRDIPMVVCFEGWDAAGKGGAIRRLTSSLDARGFDVVPIAAPTALEKSHHHLWRFWNALPKNGDTAIFDRTWYGRVMVERIEGFCTEAQWKRAYEEMNRFEAEIVAHGAIICKFWMQIDSETQLSRFNDRQNSADKQWKITAEDWRNRDKWPLYALAVNEMLQKTNTADAPWTVVESNNKQFARLKVLQTVIHAIECRLDDKKD